MIALTYFFGLPERVEKRKTNKNCLGSFQVLWNKNCTTKE
jgi:hypothetical protein